MANRDDTFNFDEECEREWRVYLAHFRKDVYPMFAEFGVSFDAVLTCWFVNRLRNAIPNLDNDAGNEPWQG
jgi:hypothetical protein